jgi:hypothetical protein
VNPSLSFAPEISVQRRSRLMAGLLLSMALHAALLYAWRLGTPAPSPDQPTLTSIAVWLRPPPPPKAEPAPLTPSAPTPASAAKPKRRMAPDLIALPPPTPAAPVHPDAFTVEPPEPHAVPRFDPDAARKLARQMASEPDPAKAGTAVAQVPPKPLETETKAARVISQAKRRDCKDGIPGGLLAPLLLMMDKKDSGCKW